MNRTPILAALVCLSLAAADKPGSKDHPLISRMNNMYIDTYRTSPFDRFVFKTGKAHGDEAAIEGRLVEIRYVINPGGEVPSPLAIIRNYQQAIAAVGGKVMYEDNRYTNLKAVKDGKETWVQVDTAWGKGYRLTIVDKAAMVQEVVADAASFKSGLNATGHVEVPGILFDSGKSVLKPESAGAIQEVAKLLKADPAMKVYVVGHTDTVAAVDLNLKLSKARADAVVQALVAQHGIAPARLRAHGAGPFAPVATNASEEGRARNRRVELVKD